MKTCEKCGVARLHLHRHHVVPRCEGGTDEPENTMYLCANCHEDEHGGAFGGILAGRLADTPEAQAKKSASLKAKWQDPVWRANQMEKRKHLWDDPEKRKAHAVKIRAAFADPEKRKELGRRISEGRRKGLAARKNNQTNP